MFGKEKNIFGSGDETKLGWGLRKLCQDFLSDTDTKLIENSAVLGENTLEPEPGQSNQKQAAALRKKTRATSSLTL